jgi:hypothetical protein
LIDMKSHPLNPSSQTVRRALTETSGAAAAEFVIWVALLALPLMSVFDLALYAFQKMEVQNSAQMAVQSAFNTCGQKYAKPIFDSCNKANSQANAGTAAVTAGAGSTSLQSGVSVTDKTECLDGVVKSGTQTSCPTNSGDYLGVTVSFSFSPMFNVPAITSVLTNPIVSTYWMRMS